MRILSTVVTVGVLFCACVSDNEEFSYLSTKYETELDVEIESIVDNGYYLDEIHLTPYEISPDNFYALESPAMLDSVFTSISYSGVDTPHLEDLFPDNGILVIYYESTFYDCSDHTISFSDSSLFIDVTFKVPLEPHDPCPPLDLVFPIGVMPRR